MCHHAKFHQNLPNGFWNIAIFRFSRWLPSAILDFEIFKFLVSDIPIRFQTLVQRIQVVSVRLHYFLICLNIILVAIATFLDKLENMVQIHHLYIQSFHMVKRFQKSVQYIRRYSTKYASFLGHVEPDVHKWFGCHGNVPWEMGK